MLSKPDGEMAIILTGKVRRISVNILLLVLGLLVGLVTAEGILHLAPQAAQRIHDYFLYKGTARTPWMNTANELVGWAFLPNSRYTFARKNEYEVENQINSKGLRDREIPYKKERDTFRILLLGDSFSAARQVPLRFTWHKIIERKLNERPGVHKKVEIINSGVPGYGTTQELLYYRYEGYKYNPDLVLIEVFHNDISDLYPRPLQERRNEEKPYFVLNGEQLELKNFPYRRDAHNISPSGKFFPYLAYAFGPLFRGAAIGDIPARLLLYASPAPPEFEAEWEAAWKLETRLIQELKADAAKHGTNVVALFFPERFCVYPFLWRERLNSESPKWKELKWDLDKPNHRLAKIFAQEGIKYLDVTPSVRGFVDKTGALLYFPSDGHFTPEGNRLAGEVVSAWLLDQRAVPR